MNIKYDSTPMDAAEMKRVLNHLGWTQQQMADEMGISCSTMERYMRADEFPAGYELATLYITLKYKMPKEEKEKILHNFTDFDREDFMSI